MPGCLITLRLALGVYFSCCCLLGVDGVSARKLTNQTDTDLAPSLRIDTPEGLWKVPLKMHNAERFRHGFRTAQLDFRVASIGCAHEKEGARIRMFYSSISRISSRALS